MFDIQQLALALALKPKSCLRVLIPVTETVEEIGNQIKLAFTEEEDKLQENWSPHSRSNTLNSCF